MFKKKKNLDHEINLISFSEKISVQEEKVSFSDLSLRLIKLITYFSKIIDLNKKQTKLTDDNQKQQNLLELAQEKIASSDKIVNFFII